jgi:hypothetical protein
MATSWGRRRRARERGQAAARRHALAPEMKGHHGHGSRSGGGTLWRRS